MLENSVKVVLHIDETLKSDEISQLENTLNKANGIVDAHMNQRKQHLMLVDYKPKEVSSLQVLQQVSQQGIHAELIA
jgi:hypothetical protein